VKTGKSANAWHRVSGAAHDTIRPRALARGLLRIYDKKGDPKGLLAAVHALLLRAERRGYRRCAISGVAGITGTVIISICLRRIVD
jgi:hypothetical protein